MLDIVFEYSLNLEYKYYIRVRSMKNGNIMYLCSMHTPHSSPVNILKDPPQIATEGFLMVLRPEGSLE